MLSAGCVTLVRQQEVAIFRHAEVSKKIPDTLREGGKDGKEIVSFCSSTGIWLK